MPTADIIHLLPDSVANQIAAGEVIQRPASVVKELVENSVDAGATSIEIHIRDAGKTLIHVIDNGSGMSETDARMAFERHATSKISKADDLYTLHTMGFRGEALPSIAAVSEIEMRTMRHGEQLGTRLVISASAVQSQEALPCRPGTSLMVKNLFFNLPGRRRFLKKDPVELSHIVHEFERLSLVNLGLNLKFTHNGTVIHQFQAAPLSQRIGQLFGNTVERSLIPVQTETPLVKITGYVGAPSSARQRAHLQYFFVNGRNMKHPYFHKAVLNCFKDLISDKEQPNYFINFETDPSRIDVNVHPQKHEIKFEDEQVIWQVLTAAVREGLGRYNVGPAIDFEGGDVPEIPPMPQGNAEPRYNTPVDEDISAYNPFELKSPAGPPPESPRLFDPLKATSAKSSALNDGNWQKLYENFTARSSSLSFGDNAGSDATGEKAVSSSIFATPDDGDTLPFTPTSDERTEHPVIEALAVSDDFEGNLFQLSDRWIVTTSRSGLLLIDQHRAHVRILFDRILPTVADGSVAMQNLLFAESIEVTAANEAVMDAAQDMLRGLGFGLVHLDTCKWEITGMPADLGEADPRHTLLAIVADLAETGGDPESQRRCRIALSMARMAAIQPNRKLSADEMRQIVTDLFKVREPNYTPDGQPVIRQLTLDRIAQMFHR
ncbi:MAG: DNA mismatch repair endonuclease MutL [Muribaculaceae bacterium]